MIWLKFTYNLQNYAYKAIYMEGETNLYSTRRMVTVSSEIPHFTCRVNLCYAIHNTILHYFVKYEQQT